MKNSLISKNYFPQYLLFSKLIHLQKSYLVIECFKTMLFLCNTDGNGVNAQNIQTKQGKITLE